MSTVALFGASVAAFDFNGYQFAGKPLRLIALWICVALGNHLEGGLESPEDLTPAKVQLLL